LPCMMMSGVESCTASRAGLTRSMAPESAATPPEIQ
jgi:hypothetical protein